MADAGRSPARSAALQVTERFLDQLAALPPAAARDSLRRLYELSAGEAGPSRGDGAVQAIALDGGEHLLLRATRSGWLALARLDAAESRVAALRRAEELDDGGRSFDVTPQQLAQVLRSRRESPPWQQLRQVLHLSRAQEQLVGLPADGRALIKGGAGSGKTTVAVRRALSLARQGMLHGRPRVALFTPRAELVPSLVRLLRASSPTLADAVEVDTPWRWCRRWQEAHAPHAAPLDREAALELLHDAWSETRRSLSHPVLEPPLDFLLEEIEEVLLAAGLQSLERYQRAPRAGRERPLDRAGREAVWTVYTGFRQRYELLGKLPRPSLIRRAARSVERGLVPPYDHVLVDGAHELGVPELLLIRSLAGGGSLTLFTELEAPLWRPGLRFADAGLVFTGRSWKLPENRRSRRPILELARRLWSPREAAGAAGTPAVAEPCLWSDAEPTQLPLPFPGSLGGRRPVLVPCAGWREELEAAADIMADALQRGVRAEGIAFLARERPVLELLSALLGQRDLPHRLHRPDQVDSLDAVLSAGAARLMTLSEAAGLGFALVVLLDLNDGSFPREGMGEDARELRRSRRLLYLGMTRAIEELWMTCRADRRSPLLPRVGYRERDTRPD